MNIPQYTMLSRRERNVLKNEIKRELINATRGSFNKDGNWGNTTLSSYLTISNSDGEESTRVDDVGIHLRVPKKTWLKTKLANYLGINYL